MSTRVIKKAIKHLYLRVIASPVFVGVVTSGTWNKWEFYYMFYHRAPDIVCTYEGGH